MVMLGKVELLDAEAKLTDRERMCLAGYMVMKDTDSTAKKKAYVFSRTYIVKDPSEILQKKVDAWFDSAKVQAFITLWQPSVPKIEKSESGEDETTQEDNKYDAYVSNIVERYEKLYQEIDDPTEKAKILKNIADTMHKNKDRDNFKEEEVEYVKFFLPMLCGDCVLYQREREEIKQMQ